MVAFRTSPLTHSSRSHLRHHHHHAFRPSKHSEKKLSLVFQQEKIVNRLFSFLSFDDLYAMAHTSRKWQHLMESSPHIRSYLFERYVPGFRFVNMYWDPKYVDKEVPVQLEDLGYLCESFFSYSEQTKIFCVISNC